MSLITKKVPLISHFAHKFQHHPKHSITGVPGSGSRRGAIVTNLPTSDGTGGQKYRFSALLHKIRISLGTSDLLRELRLKSEEYAHTVEDILTKRKSNAYAEEYPYVALRKKIEAMSRTGVEEYEIQYHPFLSKPKIHNATTPVYATGYDNERQRQAKKRSFMFGLSKADRYDLEPGGNIDEYVYDPKQKPERDKWISAFEIDSTVLAMIFSAANLFRFPHACYVNGGIIFFFVYCVLMVTLIQPLILFEFLIGQFSFKGEWGFAQLHKYSRGFSYALLFVNLTFVTLQNTIIGYTGLYAIGASIANPGECHPEWGGSSTSCIPYYDMEHSKSQLIQRRLFIEQHYQLNRNSLPNTPLYLSTEIFFRHLVYDWKNSKDTFHWRFVLFFGIVLVFTIPSSIHTYLVSTTSRIWIFFACLLPIFLALILFHQYAFRDAHSTPKYFSEFNWSKLGTVSFWCDAFEMAITTVGVGFGGLIRISARNDFRFNKVQRTSWVLSFLTMVFGLLSVMVVYTELEILGAASEAKEFTDIIVEGFRSEQSSRRKYWLGLNEAALKVFFLLGIGVTFVCLSGALLKVGPIWILTLFYTWITIFNVFPVIVSSQMAVSYLKSWLPVKDKLISNCISVAIVILCQVVLVSIYISHTDFAVTDSFDLFGGSSAACLILLTEMGIAFLLCGFREFMTDIEIMVETPMTFTFQIQMKYYVPSGIMMAYFVIAVSWLKDLPVLIENQTTSGHTYTIGFLLNSIPILIILGFAYAEFHKRIKVWPMIGGAITSENREGVETFLKNKNRWTGRRGALTLPEKRSRGSGRAKSVWAALVNQLGRKMAIHDAEEAYTSHVSLRDKLRELYADTEMKLKWMSLTNRIVKRKRIKSFAQATHYLLRANAVQTTSRELAFLKKIIHQCSILDVAACTQEKLQEKYVVDQEALLLEQLIDNMGLSSEEWDSSDSSSNSNAENTSATASSWFSGASGDAHSVSSASLSSSIYRRVVGKPDKSPEEIRLDLCVRIKRSLDLPLKIDLSNLYNLKRERLLNEWQVVRRYDGPPEEHFITVKITKPKETQFLVGLRVIVLPNYDHFVLKRLPLPRPQIVYVTQEQLNNLPGEDAAHKIFSLAMSKMKDQLSNIDLDILLKPSKRISLLDNLNADIYNFIDPLKTCVIVVESRETVKIRTNKFRWLTPPLRRQHREEELPPEHEYTYEVEEATIMGLAEQQKEYDRTTQLWNEPSDITFHPSWTETGESSVGEQRVDRTSSSKIPYYEQSEVYAGVPRIPLPRPNTWHGPGLPSARLVDETVMHQTFNPGRHALTSSSDTSVMSKVNVKHLTNEDWQRRKAEYEIPVVTIHERVKPFRKSDPVISPILPKLFKGVKFDAEANTGPSLALDVKRSKGKMSMFPVSSQDPERLKPKSLEGLSLVSTKPSRFPIDYSNLKNDQPNFWYYSDGKTLIIEKMLSDEFLFATNDDSIASHLLSFNRRTQSKLSRTSGKTSLGKKKSHQSLSRKSSSHKNISRKSSSKKIP